MIQLNTYLRSNLGPIFESVSQVPLAEIYDKYEVFFNGFTELNAHSPEDGVNNFNKSMEISGGNAESPCGMNIGSRSAANFFKDYKIKSITAPQYIGFKGNQWSISNVKFNSPDIQFDDFLNDLTFKNCEFNSDGRIVFHNGRGPVTFVSSKLKAPSVLIDKWVTISAESTTISADKVSIKIYNEIDFNEIEPIFSKAGLGFEAAGGKVDVVVKDGALVGSLLNDSDDIMWDANEINVDINVKFGRKFRAGTKNLIFKLVKRGKEYEVK